MYTIFSSEVCSSASVPFLSAVVGGTGVGSRVGALARDLARGNLSPLEGVQKSDSFSFSWIQLVSAIFMVSGFRQGIYFLFRPVRGFSCARFLDQS